MVLFVILGVIVLLTIVVLTLLFFFLNKEAKKEEAVPLTDMAQIKKELSTQLFEQSNDKVVENGPEIIPVFSPKVSLPLEDAEQMPEAEDPYKKRALELENELLTIAKKAEGQSNDARQMVESLTKENESLKAQKAQLETAQARLNDIHKEAEGLKSDNLNLQAQLDATSAKVQLLEEQMSAVKFQMADEINQAKSAIDRLKQEKEDLLAAPKEIPHEEALHQELETLKIQIFQYNQKHEELERQNKELEGEFIKAKAKASALERVCSNYKFQLEALLQHQNP